MILLSAKVIRSDGLSNLLLDAMEQIPARFDDSIRADPEGVVPKHSEAVGLTG